MDSLASYEAARSHFQPMIDEMDAWDRQAFFEKLVHLKREVEHQRILKTKKELGNG